METTDDLELLGRKLGGASSFEELANQSVEVCSALAGAEICTLWRVYLDDSDNKRLRLAAAKGIDAPQTLATEVTYPITPGGIRTNGISQFEGITSYVASERKAVLVHSYDELIQDYKFAHKGAMDRIQWKDEPQTRMRNLYAMPVTLGNELVAVLKVENKRGQGSFTREDIAALDMISRQIAIVAKALVLLDSHERRLIDAPARLAKALVRPFESDKLTKDIVDTTAETLDAEICTLWLKDPSGRNLIHQASYGFRGKAQEVPPYRIDQVPEDTDEGDKQIKGITAWVAIRRKAFWANSHEELRKHNSWQGTWDKVMFGSKDDAREKFRSLYAVPLVWNDELLGVLKVENPRHARHFGPTDRLKCDIMANYVVLLLALTSQLKIQLVPGMAHILNTPAVSIANLLELIEREINQQIPDFAELRKWVGLVRRSALTITVMSRTLSAEVGARSGPQPLKDTELVETLDRFFKKIEPFVPPEIEVRIDLGTERFHFEMSRPEVVWVEVIFFNLLHNAIKYSSMSDGPWIRLTCHHEEQTVCISVSDNGPGILLEDLPHIFEPMFRKDAKGWPEGTGLGLFEVRRLVERLGWRIEVTNTTPGARFEIHVPLDWRKTVQ